MRFGVVALALAVTSACAPPSRTSKVAQNEPHRDDGDVSAQEPGGAAEDSEDSLVEVEEAPDDGAEEHDDAAPTVGEERPHPLDGWSDEQIKDAIRIDMKKLGPMSLGIPSAGLLLNGVQAAKNDLFDPVSPGAAWATEETLSYLERALRKVHEEVADTPALPLGDISAEKGGPISPHLSHQAGRDVNIAYFYRGDGRWYRRGNAKNLDLPRNWAFVRALVTETDVELILIDNSIQGLLREHALSIGEDPVWVDGIFRGGNGLRPIIRHARGHATHVHVRFFNPLAQETARRAYAGLVDNGIVPPVQSFIQHRARRGDTLGKLSKKYGVSVVAIKQANRLKKSLIREKHTYLIPVARPRPAPPSRRLTFPAATGPAGAHQQETAPRPRLVTTLTFAALARTTLAALAFLAFTSCNKGPTPELVRLELPAMVTSTDPAQALVRARYQTRGSVVSPGPHEYAVNPPDVATVTPNGAVTCTKVGDARISVSVQGVKDDETLHCRLVDKVEVGELPPLDVTKGPVTVPARALAKGGKELSDVTVVLSSERPNIVRVSGNSLMPISVGEAGIVARAGNAERRLKARAVRTLNLEALPLDGGRRINMSLKEGKYELSVTLRTDRSLNVEWRGAPYCAYRSTGKTHKSGCVMQGKGGVVFDNPAFLEGGSTDVSTQGVILAEVP